MAGLSLTQVEAKLTLWLAAEEKIAEGQAYTIGDRSLTRADLGLIAERINFYNNQVKHLSRGGIRYRRGVPLG